MCATLGIFHLQSSGMAEMGNAKHLATKQALNNQNPRTIHIFGKFLPQDFNRLDAMLEQMEKRRPLTDITVTLDSPGGAYFEGLRLGLLLHRKGIGTQIMPGATCFSACATIFFGGFDRKTGRPNRVAHEGSRLGVHRFSPPRRPLAHQDEVYRHGFAAAKSYFADMRVSEKIWRMFEETPPEGMYIVTPSDMAESDITFVPASKADALSVAPGGPQFAAAGNGSPPNNEPRKIKTLPVRGDQPDGAAAPVTSAKTLDRLPRRYR